MIEFKFPCPSCGQHIQATDGHSGMQINCPVCQKPMVVPLAPGAVAAAPAVPNAPLPQSTTPPPTPPPFPPSAAAAAPAMGRPAAKKSNTKWVVGGCVVALFALGAGAGFLYLNSQSADRSAVASNPSPKVAAVANETTNAAPAEAKALTVAEIVQKVTDQYATMTNFSAKGTAVSIMDMSKVDTKKMVGATKVPASNAKDLKDVMSKPITTQCDFTMRLARADFYRIDWENKVEMAAGPKGFVPPTMKGGAWSAGDGNFIALTPGKYTKMDTREMTLATATGVSGGAAATIPSIFFNTQFNLLSFFKDAKQGDDDIIDGEECYVLNGETMGMKTVLWITKAGFLIKQKETILGGKSTAPEVSEADMDKGLNQLGSMTAEQKAQAKALAKNMKPMMAKMKGTMTETYLNIEINKPLKKEDFQYPLPAGATLSKTLF